MVLEFYGHLRKRQRLKATMIWTVKTTAQRLLLDETMSCHNRIVHCAGCRETGTGRATISLKENISSSLAFGLTLNGFFMDYTWWKINAITRTTACLWQTWISKYLCEILNIHGELTAVIYQLTAFCWRMQWSDTVERCWVTINKGFEVRRSLVRVIR